MAPAKATRRTRRKRADAERARDPLPGQRGKNGPRPGALDADDLRSVLDYNIELAIAVLLQVVLLQRIATAGALRPKPRIKGVEEWLLSQAEDDSDRLADAVNRAIRKAARADRPSMALADTFRQRARRLVSVSSLQRMDEASFGSLRHSALTSVKENAQALRRGFGDAARRYLIDLRASAAEEALRKLNPRKGSKQIRSLVATAVGLSDESALRKRRQ